MPFIVKLVTFPIEREFVQTAEAIRLMSEIEGMIETHGGWPVQ